MKSNLIALSHWLSYDGMLAARVLVLRFPIWIFRSFDNFGPNPKICIPNTFKSNVKKPIIAIFNFRRQFVAIGSLTKMRTYLSNRNGYNRKRCVRYSESSTEFDQHAMANILIYSFRSFVWSISFTPILFSLLVAVWFGISLFKV